MVKSIPILVLILQTGENTNKFVAELFQIFTVMYNLNVISLGHLKWILFIIIVFSNLFLCSRA